LALGYVKKKFHAMSFELCTPGVNFINILRAAFTHADPESVKFQLSRHYHFTLLGYTRIKDAKKNVNEIETWCRRTLRVESKSNLVITSRFGPAKFVR
jgi:hypothetical protein